MLFSCLLACWCPMAQSKYCCQYDSVYCIVVNCFGKNNEEPQTHTLLIPTNIMVKFDISGLSCFEKKMKEDYYAIPPFHLYLIEMAKFSFPDSSCQFQNSIYNINLSKWIDFNSNCLTDTITMNNGQLFITIALLRGQLQIDNTYRLPVRVKEIQSITPIKMEDMIMRGEMVLLPE